MNAAIYSRKSKFTGKGESVENQIQLCRDYGKKYLGAADNDFIIYEDEGFSGGNINRPQFQKLLRDARAKRFDVLICYRLDRISRNVSDFSQLINELNRLNISFVSIREQFDTATPMGRAMMYIASVFSQLERETIAERIRDNMQQLAKTGRWLGGNPPTGFRSAEIAIPGLDGKVRKMFRLEPVEDEIRIVKLIFDRYLQYRSITRVEKHLIENNLQTKNGLDFHRFSVRFILSNPVYAIANMGLYDYLTEKGYCICSEPSEFNGVNGLACYNKTRQGKGKSGERFNEHNEWIIAVGQHTGIIPGDVWIETQRLLESNSSKSYRREKTSQALLSGILRCGVCGSFMRPKTIQRYDSEGRQVYYYMCERKEKSRKTKCDIQNINGNLLDMSVVSALKDIIKKFPPVFEGISGKNDLIEASGKVPDENEILKAEITDTAAEINNLINALSKGLKEDALSAVLSKVEELADRKENMERRLVLLNHTPLAAAADLEGPNSTALKLGTIDDSVWELMDASEKRNIIKSIVDRIIWDGKRIDMLLPGSENVSSMKGLQMKY